MAGVKGKSGRKPNERPIRHFLSKKLDEIDARTGKTYMLSLIDTIVEQAIDGDMSAVREVFDRLEGKPKQMTEHSGPDGNAIPHTLTVRFE